MSRNFLRRPAEVMHHGAELVALYLGSDESEVHTVFNLADPKEERRFYTVDTIVAGPTVARGRGGARTPARRTVPVL